MAQVLIISKAVLNAFSRARIGKQNEETYKRICLRYSGSCDGIGFLFARDIGGKAVRLLAINPHPDERFYFTI
jgi:hypothetical protein